jgi:GNAT superfamily N-acetyltransferase
MDHLKWISGTDLNEAQLDQVAHLIFETGYYEYSALNNKLNLSPIEFHKVQTLKPYTEYMHVLIDRDEVAGFFIVGTKSQFAAVEQNTPDWYRDDPELASGIEKIIDYYIHETLNTDLISYGIAIHSKYRGQGLFRLLNEARAKLARKENCTRIAFVVWETKAAVDIFRHCGAKIIGDIDLRQTYFKDRLLKGVFDL